MIWLLYIVFGIYFLRCEWRIYLGSEEIPTFDVEHYDAGAGDYEIICLFITGVVIVVFSLINLIRIIDWQNKIPLAVILITTPMLFFSMAFNHQQFGSAFDEKTFLDLEASEMKFKKTEIVSRLGQPLMKGININGNEQWSYSYMPSTGFGWSKRVIEFDQGGVTTRVFGMEEP